MGSIIIWYHVFGHRRVIRHVAIALPSMMDNDDCWNGLPSTRYWALIIFIFMTTAEPLRTNRVYNPLLICFLEKLPWLIGPLEFVITIPTMWIVQESVRLNMQPKHHAGYDSVLTSSGLVNLILVRFDCFILMNQVLERIVVVPYPVMWRCLLIPLY